MGSSLGKRKIQKLKVINGLKSLVVVRIVNSGSEREGDLFLGCVYMPTKSISV